MNKRMKFLFALLFVVIVILAVAIARFFSDTGQQTADGGTQAVISHKLEKDGSGNLIFQDSSGLCGIADSNNRIIVSPEWKSLRFAESGICIAEKHIGGKDLFGCISYDGDIIVPFIYKTIERHSVNDYVFYTACVYKDENYVVYDSHFSPCLRNSWRKCDVSSKGLTLGTNRGNYDFYITKNGIALNNASLSGYVSSCSYNIEITSKLLLSKLTVPMIETMAEDAGKYLRYAFFEEDELLDDIRSAGNAVFTPIFPNEDRIVSKILMKIPDIFLYSVRSEDGIPHYAIAITADTLISYHDDNNNLCNLRDNYKAVVEFTGHSAADLEAVSGSFLLSTPEYPQPEPDEQPDETADIPNGSENKSN